MLAEFLTALPEVNKENLRKHAKEKVGIFNPTLYSEREKL